MLVIKNLHKSYKMGDSSLHVLKGINLKVNKGEMVAIMGSSGSGKSTLLNIIGILDELDSRWALLEGAFTIKADNYELANEILDTYLLKGVERKNLTNNIPFLQGYQGNICFYCAEKIEEGDCHVDHVLPRMVLNHDQIWNLVLAHSYCNMSKSDKVIGEHFMEKLIQRNENIMGSNHPWKHKISSDLGRTKKLRASNLLSHYENVKSVLGKNYWFGTSSYNPQNDDFYKKLITRLNN